MGRAISFNQSFIQSIKNTKQKHNLALFSKHELAVLVRPPRRSRCRPCCSTVFGEIFMLLFNQCDECKLTTIIVCITAGDLVMVKLSDLVDDGVKCLDGSPVVYYVRRNSQSTDWVVYFQGGSYFISANEP